LGGGFGEGLDGFGGGGAGGFWEARVWGWMGQGADEAFEIAMDGDGEEVSAFGRFGAVGVGNAFGCEPDVARADAMLLVLDDEAEFAFEDVEDLVFGVVDVQWGGIAKGDAMFENGDAVLAFGMGDANGDGGAEEPEGSGVHGSEVEGGFWMFSGGRGGFKAEFCWILLDSLVGDSDVFVTPSQSDPIGPVSMLLICLCFIMVDVDFLCQFVQDKRD
jgi:hypothetical protein